MYCLTSVSTVAPSSETENSAPIYL